MIFRMNTSTTAGAPRGRGQHPGWRRRAALLAAMVSASLPLAAAAPVDSATLERYRWLMELPTGELFRRAEHHRQQGHYDSAQVYFSFVAGRYSPSLDSAAVSLCARSLLGQGLINYNNFNYAEAMNHFLRCSDIAEAHGMTSIMAEASKNIGNIYSQYGDFERSRSFYELSLAQAVLPADTQTVKNVLYDLAIAAALSGHVRRADSCLQQLAALRLNSPEYHYNVNVARAVIRQQQGHDDEAYRLYAATLARALRDSLELPYIGACRSNMSLILGRQGRYAEALSLLRQNEREATGHQQQDLLTATMRETAELYKRMGDMANYYAFLSRFYELYDETFSLTSFNQLKNVQFMHELQRSTREINRLTEEHTRLDERIRRQWLTIGAISCLLIGLMLLALVVYRQKRHLSRAYTDLFQRNRDILDSEQAYRRRLAETEQRLALSLASPAPALADGLPSRAAQTSQEPQDVLQRVLHVMEHSDAFLQSDFSVERLAQMVGSTSRAVSGVISDEYGKNFRSFLNEYRIKEAMRRLSDVEHYGNYTIRAIAESVGYKSQSNFIAVFTQVSGIKPSIYQKLAMEQLRS